MLDARSIAGPPIYRFGEFRLDVARRLLFRRYRALPLPERIFQILLMLVEANGGVVHREAIASRVWPDAAVADGNIAQHVYLLRRILGEHARDRGLVMAVSRQGYRLSAPVIVEPAGLADTVEDCALEPFPDYCEASYLLERRTAPALKRAIEIFEGAPEPSCPHVPSLIGLARAYTLLAQDWHVPPAMAFRVAKDAVRQALAIASSSAAAHSMLSSILLYADWDWSSAKAELDLALRLNPNSSIVRAQVTEHAICAGDYDHAIYESKRALMAEPSSLSRRLMMGVALIHAGDYAAGVARMSKLLESDGELQLARRYRAQAFLLNRQPAEALADLLLLPQERAEEPRFRLPLLARAYADCGETLRAEQLYASLQVMAATEYVVPWNLAIVACGLGRLDEGMAHLAAAFDRREPALLFLKSLPWFEGIAGQPRFKEILHAVGP
ncbi:MAG: winged helix-turn-helix domain-containing protein [Candidatus Eremiobacteraeota bacterium]|nr:winged helix-turn-helix domain-containing protein [Candidatus Eremiobacteraeota bacterium]MBV8498241.1 winged helix-turn-helix domain-containing protein [Candidatus Eremiobacteraeota bacterium]